MRAFCTAILCLLAALPAYSQTGTLAGTISRDSSGAALGEAEVQLPELNLTVRSNWMGQFRFPKVPAGRHAVTVRAVGFDPYVDSIDVKAGAIVSDDIVLTASPVGLEAQRTTAERRPPPGLEDMEARMNAHIGGFFVTDSVLRANEARKLTYLLAGVAGLHQSLGLHGDHGVYLANGRERGNGGPVFSTGGGGSICYVGVYVDGNKLFVGPASDGNPPPDFEAMWTRDYSGIEYYASGSTVPPQYNSTGASCGVLLLWTRR